MTPAICRLLVVPALFWAVLPTLRAQNVLITEFEGTKAIVRGARGTRPLVEQGGRMVLADGYRVALRPVEEYLPVFISVRIINVSTETLTDVDTGLEINNKFHFNAEFESPYALDNVFVVLDLRGEQAGRVFFLYEIGRMEAREQKHVTINVPMSFPLGRGRYYYHVFVDGMEALHSGIPVEEREAALDRTVAKRIGSVQSGALTLLLGPEPEYPDSLRKAKVKGRAVVAVHVTATGRPVNAFVKEATDPAFGESALEAVRLWRFLPVVRNGRPVESAAEIPFEFSPPPPEAAK